MWTLGVKNPWSVRRGSRECTTFQTFELGNGAQPGNNNFFKNLQYSTSLLTKLSLGKKENYYPEVREFHFHFPKDYYRLAASVLPPTEEQKLTHSWTLLSVHIGLHPEANIIHIALQRNEIRRGLKSPEHLQNKKPSFKNTRWASTCLPESTGSESHSRSPGLHSCSTVFKPLQW